jgi:D-alanyl-lipoteichoic acid acyltransferase DltB (MBOAT superfamily)
VSDVVAQDRKLPNLKELWQMTSTFAFVTFAWVFFRAESVNKAFSYIEYMVLNLNIHSNLNIDFLKIYLAFILIFSMILLEWNYRYNERDFTLFAGKRNKIFILIIILILYFSHLNDKSMFIYFQF